MKISRIDKNNDNHNYDIAQIYDDFLFKIKHNTIFQKVPNYNFNFIHFLTLYKFFINQNEDHLIESYLMHYRKEIVVFLNNLVEFEKEIKNILFKDFYNTEITINKNFEILIFRYFFHNKASNEEINKKHEKEILSFIYEIWINNGKKRSLFEEISEIFCLYDFKNKKEINNYLNSQKQIMNLRNEIMHPSPIEKLFKNNDLITYFSNKDKESKLNLLKNYDSIFNKFFKNERNLLNRYSDHLNKIIKKILDEII